MDLKFRLEGSERLLARQEYQGAVARKVDKFEAELRRLGLHEHWHEDRIEFGQKIADPGEKVDYWKHVLAGLDILLKTYGTPERIYMKSVKDVEEAFHARMCEAAEEQCGEGDAEACRTACEDCGIEEVCAPAKAGPAVTWRRFPDHKSETRAVK